MQVLEVQISKPYGQFENLNPEIQNDDGRER